MGNPSPSPAELGFVRDHDRLLPIANVSRVMKRALPETAKVGKDAKEAIQECVSEFIGFVTSEASERLKKEKRKTINGPDLIVSMRALGFEQFLAVLDLFLQRYRMVVKGDGSDVKRGRKKRKLTAPPSSSSSSLSITADETETATEGKKDRGRSSSVKKVSQG